MHWVRALLGRGVLLSVLGGVAPLSAFGADEPKTAESPVALQRPPPVVPRFFLRRGGQRIESGLRIESRSDGVRVATKVFGPGGKPEGLKVPAHLGGGYLFYQPLAAEGSSATAFYRADTWTGPLRPLTRVPFAVRQVEPGMDRIYALGVTLRVAFDLESGDLLPLAPLPPLVTITALAVAGPRRALVEGPLVGVLYTSDAGQTWRPLADVQRIEPDVTRTHLLAWGSKGLSLVGESGELMPVSSSLGTRSGTHTAEATRELLSRDQRSADAADEQEFSEGPSGVIHRDQLERRWLAVLTQGAPYKGQAYALDQGELLTLSLDESLKLTARSTSVPQSLRCFATAKEGASPIFLCRGETTEVFKLKPRAHGQLGVTPVWKVQKLTSVLAHGDGGILFLGPCHESRGVQRRACLVSQAGEKELSLPEEAVGGPTRHAWAVSDNEAKFVWIDSAKKQILARTLGRPGAPSTSPQSWNLPEDHAVSPFLLSGALLPHASLSAEGISLWATEREKFVGILLGEGVEPAFGAIQRPLQRALFNGRRALVWGAAGFAKQSSDGGQTFIEFALPYRSGDPELASVTHPTSALLMGCSDVGCALGRMLRIGWETHKETFEELPASRPLSIPGPTRLRFTCGEGQVQSRPRRDDDTQEFPNFWEEQAPRVLAGSDRLSVAFSDGLLRMYVWGLPDRGWGRSSFSQVAFVAPFDPGKIQTTAPTRQLYSSFVEAQTTLGLIDRVNGFRYHVYDPAGDGGVMVSRGRTDSELYVFEQGKPLEAFRLKADQKSRSLMGAVRSRGSFVAAFSEGTEMILARLSDGEALDFAQFSLGESGKRGASLVRTDQGDLGIFMEGDAGSFVYPVSTEGELGQPIVVPFASEQPLSCPSEATGFIVDQELTVSPYLESTAGAPLGITRVRARTIFGYGKSCIAGLSGAARDLPRLAATSRQRQQVILSVIDSDASGLRRELSCQ